MFLYITAGDGDTYLSLSADPEYLANDGYPDVRGAEYVNFNPDPAYWPEGLAVRVELADAASR